jgi:hypothetical protein
LRERWLALNALVGNGARGTTADLTVPEKSTQSHKTECGDFDHAYEEGRLSSSNRRLGKKV